MSASGKSFHVGNTEYCSKVSHWIGTKSGEVGNHIRHERMRFFLSGHSTLNLLK